MVLPRLFTLVAVLLIAFPADAGLRLQATGGRANQQIARATQESTSWFDAPASDEREINALYAQIDQATSSFQGALELKRSGSPKTGEEKANAALAALTRAAERCAEIATCETRRFFTAYEAMIRLQTLVLSETSGLDEPAANPQLDEERQRIIGARMPEMHRSLTLLKGRKLSEVIALNEPVKAALDEWLTWMRPQLIETYKNYAYMRPLMLPAYEEAGLPEAILFGILAKESVGRVHSYSRAGAAGPLQFMPDTARRMGLGSENGFDMRLDPAASARANVSYINEQLARLNNDLEMTLAAYNSGEGRVGRLAQRYRKGFWNDSVYFSLPSETRDYVPKVLAAAYLFLHPEEFNLKFPQINSVAVELKIERAVSLGELTICLGQEGREDGWFRTLRNLNPRLKPDQRLAPGTLIKMPQAALLAYDAQCKNSKFMERVADLHEARNPTGPSFVPYVVRRGDTLAAIARRTSCMGLAALANFNAIAAPQDALKPGQRIKLPSCT